MNNDNDDNGNQSEGSSSPCPSSEPISAMKKNNMPIARGAEIEMTEIRRVLARNPEECSESTPSTATPVDPESQPLPNSSAQPPISEITCPKNEIDRGDTISRPINMSEGFRDHEDKQRDGQEREDGENV